MKPTVNLGAKGRALLRVIVTEINSKRIRPADKTSFIPYWEALDKLGVTNPKLFSGRRLQREGLTELNEWTKASVGIPHICGLIVAVKNWEPSDGYPQSHGYSPGHSWKSWWMQEVAKSVAFNWKPYI